MTTHIDILDLDATYHRPGARRLAENLGVTLAAAAPPLTCGPCGGAVLTASGRHRCVRCGRDYGPVEMASGPSDDDCDSNGRA